MPNRKDRAQALAARSRFWIDDLHVQPDRLVVLRGKEEIKLELRMMEVLVILAEHAGVTITKEELLVGVWGNTFYGDSPVSKTVSRLRDLIGDEARNPRYIETVSKVGFRMKPGVTLPEDYRRMPTNPWKEGSPYVGLSAFDAKHSSVFCGRSRIVGDLLRAMRSQMESGRRFVMIVGASGCGKTSLLRAGAIPLLTKADGFEGLHALSVADCDLAAAHGGDPLAPLVAALATWTLDGRPVFPPQTVEQLRAQFSQSPDSITGFVAEALRSHAGRNLEEEPLAHLLLTIDHAETLVASDDIDTKAREAFERLILTLCDCPHVLVTMIARSDFYPKLIETLPALAERKAGDGHLDVLPPRYGEIGEIIRTPAWKANLSFEMDPDSRDRLDDVLRDAAIVQPDALPLLQHTLEALYELRNDQQQLTFTAYNEIGGLEGAIAHRAEQVFAMLPEKAQNSLDALLTRLIVIRPDSDAVSARRADLEAFDAGARTLIDAFAAPNARLFVRDLHNGHPTVGVVHEALLRRWPRVVEWVQDNRRLLQAKARLQRAATRWEEEGRQDDHLLNPGRPLVEALEIESIHPSSLGNQERDFINASAQIFNRKRRLRRGAIVTLATLTLIASFMASIAQVALTRADARRAETQDILSYTIGALVEKIEPTGNIEQLESISQKVISHYMKQPISEMKLPDLANYSKALRILGTVRRDQGQKEDAAILYGLSLEISGMAISLDNNNSNAWFEQAQSIYYLGHLEFLEGRYKKADKKWMTYLRIARTFTAARPSDQKWILEESYALNNLGSSSLRQGEEVVALRYFRGSVDMKKRLIDLDPNSLNYRFEWIDSRSWVISALEAKGDLVDASKGYDDVINELRKLIHEKKNSNIWKLRLSNYLLLSAKNETSLENRKKAFDAAREGVDILTRLTQLEPDNKDWASNLQRGLRILAATDPLINQNSYSMKFTCQSENLDI